MGFRRVVLTDAGPFTDQRIEVAQVRIGGVPLEQLVSQRPDGDGDARPLELSWVLERPTSIWDGMPYRLDRRRLGLPSDQPDGPVPVLNCHCGDFGCGGELARIDVGEDVVTWSVVGRPGPPFTFARSQYLAALAHLVRPRVP